MIFIFLFFSFFSQIFKQTIIVFDLFFFFLWSLTSIQLYLCKLFELGSIMLNKTGTVHFSLQHLLVVAVFVVADVFSSLLIGYSPLQPPVTFSIFFFCALGFGITAIALFLKIISLAKAKLSRPERKAA